MDEGLSRPDVAMCICSAATKAGFEKVVNSVVGKARLDRCVGGTRGTRGEQAGGCPG